MKTLSLAVAILIISVSVAYAAHTDKEHTEEYVESEKLVEIIANEFYINRRPLTIMKENLNNDVVGETGLIFSEDDPYKDLDF